jgi:hypothetical protein
MLQFFERMCCEESDLDLYVNMESSGEVFQWLSETGFQWIEQNETVKEGDWR